MVVRGGWGIDHNGNLVITWRWWGWESKNVIFEKKNWWHFRELYELVGWIGQKKNPRKAWVSFRFDFEFWVNLAKTQLFITLLIEFWIVKYLALPKRGSWTSFLTSRIVHIFLTRRRLFWSDMRLIFCLNYVIFYNKILTFNQRLQSEILNFIDNLCF